MEEPKSHEPGTGTFPGVPFPVTNQPEDVQQSTDDIGIFFLDTGGDEGAEDGGQSEVELTLRLLDPRDGSAISGISLMPSGTSGASDEEGLLSVTMATNESFSLACSGPGYAPGWLAGTLGGSSTELVLNLLPELGLEQVLGTVGVIKDSAKANLLIRAVSKDGTAAVGATVSRSPVSGTAYIITGPSAVLGDAVMTVDTPTIGLTNISPGVTTISVETEDDTPCSVQPGGGESLALTLSMGATGSLSFLCP